jgi:hypothetical protein
MNGNKIQRLLLKTLLEIWKTARKNVIYFKVQNLISTARHTFTETRSIDGLVSVEGPEMDFNKDSPGFRPGG